MRTPRLQHPVHAHLVAMLVVAGMIWGLFLSRADAATKKYRLVWNANDDPATTMTVGWNQISGSNPAVHYGTDSNGTGWVSQDSNTWAGMNNTFARLTGLPQDTGHYLINVGTLLILTEN